MRDTEASGSRFKVQTCRMISCKVIHDFFVFIAAWKPVVGAAAVACSDLSNAALCRNYGLSGFPSVKVNIMCVYQVCGRYW